MSAETLQDHLWRLRCELRLLLMLLQEQGLSFSQRLRALDADAVICTPDRAQRHVCGTTPPPPQPTPTHPNPALALRPCSTTDTLTVRTANVQRRQARHLRQRQSQRLRALVADAVICTPDRAQRHV